MAKIKIPLQLPFILDNSLGEKITENRMQIKQMAENSSLKPRLQLIFVIFDT